MIAFDPDVPWVLNRTSLKSRCANSPFDEAKLTGRDPQRVIGKNFFTQVAPCTNVQRFAGKFREGVAAGELHEVFPYRFDFEMAPRDVTVTLFYSKTTETAWVFVREMARA